MRFQGTITKWKDDEGYGFITPRGGGKQVFLHISALDKSTSRPEEKSVVTYEVEVDEKDRPQARSVQYVGSEDEGARAFPKWPIAIALAILGGICTWAAIGDLPGLLPPCFIALSLISYLVYGYDKSQAQTNGWRIPESTLHLLSLLGGWPGAICAQHIMRHKIKKPSFMATFWLTVFLNCAALVVLSTPLGDELLRQVSK